MAPHRGPCALLALVGVALRAAEVDARTKSLFEVTAVIDNCFFLNGRYEPLSKSDWRLNTTAVDFRDCYGQCGAASDCQFFSFWKETRTCSLVAGSAVFVSGISPGAVAGPKLCPQVRAACTEKPGSGFPGSTSAETKLTWPSHRVPDKLECWPKNASGGYYNSCPAFSVLDDTDTGWPGLCSGMLKVPSLPPGETCESLCRKRLLCNVYQVADDGNQTCYHSLVSSGANCFLRSSDQSAGTPPLEAKRLMHGAVRVLADLEGVQILGLKQVFHEHLFPTEAGAVLACRNHCYSNIGCQWWQYSSSSGCWVEDPQQPVELPMTLASWREGSSFGASVVAGQYVQHFCPGSLGTPSASPAGGGAASGGAASGGADAVSTTPVLPASSLPPSSGGSQRSAGPPGTGEGATGTDSSSTQIPTQTLQGEMAVQGLPYESLSPDQRATISHGYVKAIASTAGVSPRFVRDEEGTPEQVTLGPSGVLDPTEGLQVGFLIDLPTGISKNDVNRALLSHAFIDEIKNVTNRAAGLDPTVLAAMEVEARVERTTPYPLSVPTTTAAAPVRNVVFGNSLQSWAFLLALLGVSLGVCSFCLFRKEDQEKAVGSPMSEKHHKRRSASPQASYKYNDSFSSDSAWFNDPPPPEPARPQEAKEDLLEGGRSYVDPRRAVLDAAFNPAVAKDQELAELQSRNPSRVPLLGPPPVLGLGAPPPAAGARSLAAAPGAASPPVPAPASLMVRPPQGAAATPSLPPQPPPARAPPPGPTRRLSGPVPMVSPQGAVSPGFPLSLSVGGSFVPDPVGRQQVSFVPRPAAGPGSVSVAPPAPPSRLSSVASAPGAAVGAGGLVSRSTSRNSLGGGRPSAWSLAAAAPVTVVQTAARSVSPPRAPRGSSPPMHGEAPARLVSVPR